MPTRGLLVVVAVVALLLGAALGPRAAGSRAEAQEPAAVVFGFIAVGAGQPAPTRVRALIGETVCGTSGQLALAGDVYLYTLVVASALEKPGCGVDGAAVRLQLLAGEIDAGVPAAQALWRRGITRVDLASVAATSVGVFVGELPAGSGLAQLRWTGPSGTAVTHAVGTIRRDVVAVYHWNTQRQQFDAYVVGAPIEASAYTVVDADDIVFVRVK